MSKAIICGVIVAALAFGLAYLTGAFCSASFNIAEWDVFGRFMVGLLGAIGGVVVGAATAITIMEHDHA